MAKKKAKKKPKAAPKKGGRKKSSIKKTASKKPAKKKSPGRKRIAATPAARSSGEPVSLEEARRMVSLSAAAPKARRKAPMATGAVVTAAGPVASDSGPSPEPVGEEREKLEEKRREEREQRIAEYTATMTLMKSRGVKGLAKEAAEAPKRRAPGRRGGPSAAAGAPLQIFAEGDSWFDYPVPLFGGGVVKRLEKRLGVPILNLAKAGDEVRFMLGVEERAILVEQFSDGCPAGGPWDVLLFSGGGNDIVGDPMALWIHDFEANLSADKLIQQSRFKSALELVRAGYEDLISLRDTLSPSTHLVFHAYDYAIPDGRGICHLGPWLQPTFELRGFPANGAMAFNVVKAMLKSFAQLLQTLAGKHAKVTFINTQGTLVEDTASWHNELHPSKSGFNQIADVFHAKLKSLFPSRVL